MSAVQVRDGLPIDQMPEWLSEPNRPRDRPVRGGKPQRYYGPHCGRRLKRSLEPAGGRRKPTRGRRLACSRKGSARRLYAYDYLERPYRTSADESEPAV